MVEQIVRDSKPQHRASPTRSRAPQFCAPPTGYLAELFDNPACRQASKHIRFAAGECLYAEGQTVKHVFLILCGLVKLVQCLPSGQCRILRLQGPQALLGLSALLQESQPTTAMALSDVEVLALPVTTLRQYADLKPEIMLHIQAAWSAKLRSADDWILKFNTGRVPERLARLILFLAQMDPRQHNQVTLLTCEDMAAILGVTLESVSRSLAAFKRRGLLQPTCDPTLKDCYQIQLAELEVAGTS